MTSLSERLAEYATPTRGRPKYAPLTAGLLARKGEAVPATPYYAAEVLDLYTSPQEVFRSAEPHARHGSPHDRPALPQRAARAASDVMASSTEDQRHLAPPIRSSQAWRPRMPALTPAEPEPRQLPEELAAVTVHSASPQTADTAATAATAQAANSSVVEQDHRVSITLDLELALLGRLARHARHSTEPPARIIEAALRAHLPEANGLCPSCAHALGDLAE